MDGGSLFINPLGQNGNVFSATYDNLLQDWCVLPLVVAISC